MKSFHAPGKDWETDQCHSIARNVFIMFFLWQIIVCSSLLESVMSVIFGHLITLHTASTVSQFMFLEDTMLPFKKNKWVVDIQLQ